MMEVIKLPNPPQTHDKQVLAQNPMSNQVAKENGRLGQLSRKEIPMNIPDLGQLLC